MLCYAMFKAQPPRNKRRTNHINSVQSEARARANEPQRKKRRTNKARFPLEIDQMMVPDLKIVNCPKTMFVDFEFASALFLTEPKVIRLCVSWATALKQCFSISNFPQLFF